MINIPGEKDFGWVWKLFMILATVPIITFFIGLAAGWFLRSQILP